MVPLWYLFYNSVGVPLMYGAFHAASLFSGKIQRGIQGRKDLFPKLDDAVKPLQGRHPRIWIHVSSMGEFEQAKPLIRELKGRHPEGAVFVSFFSPSGYDNVKQFESADVVSYIPFDSRKQAGRFVNTLNPDIAVMVRYDLWPNHLMELAKRRIPVLLINASVRHHRTRKFPLLNRANRSIHRIFSAILTVSQEATDSYNQLLRGDRPVETVGDTRYDQVVRRAREAAAVIEPLTPLKYGRRTVVAGSTWPSDEAVLFEALSRMDKRPERLWVILVPHEPTPDHVQQMERNLKDLSLSWIRLSQLSQNTAPDRDVLIVDRIGILASLYALGDITFVGGGFGPGVHNVLEPAALGKVVLFGPRCTNSYETGQLRDRGVGFVMENASDLVRFMDRYLTDSGALSKLGTAAAAVVKDNVGATRRIADRILDLISES